MHKQQLERRTFLKGALGALLWPGSIGADNFSVRASAPLLNAKAKERSLIIIQLAGGNDHFNTVVRPNKSYYQARPKLAKRPESLIPVSAGASHGELAFNGNLPYLASLFQAGQLAVVESLSYPQPSRSHELATEIWQGALREGRWFERLATLMGAGQGAYSSPLLEAEQWPAALLSSLRLPVTHLTFSGFDGHDGEHDHDFLLAQLDRSLANLALNKEKAWGDVQVLIYSEFGRELAQNQYGGSDHGRKSTAFVLGSGIKGGFYGPAAESDDWLDFRTVYATIAGAFGVSGRELLGADFESLNFL